MFTATEWTVSGNMRFVVYPVAGSPEQPPQLQAAQTAPKKKSNRRDRTNKEGTRQ